MQALVLEKQHELSLRDIDISEEEKLGEADVRIRLNTVGICGSDVHYYTHGKIGPFVVTEPMILGHEASGTVIEAGRAVKHLKAGDRVCMEPGIPDPRSVEYREGQYNLDPAVRFWATPPVHGVTRTEVVHPADFTFKLPDSVSYAAGAMVEPLAVGMHAATKARVAPGDVALVFGAGTIGLVTVLSALAAGCSKVIVTDLQQPKLDIAAGLGPVVAVNAGTGDLAAAVNEQTAGRGADVVFEATGAPPVLNTGISLARPGGVFVYIGMPVEPVPFDVVAAQAKELRFETIFRYAHVYPRAISLLGSGQIDLSPLITETYPFERSVEAYDYAVSPKPTSVKVQIAME